MSTSLRRRRQAAGTVMASMFDDVLLALVVLVLAVPIMQPLMAQQASRYALTGALWDDNTIVLNDYAESLSVDYAERDGNLLSDKSPGQPVLSLPAYGLYRALGGEPAALYRPWGNLGLWWNSVWASAIPAAILAILMRRRGLALGWSGGVATFAALGLSTATMLLPFATQLFSHVLTAALVYASLTVLRTWPRSAGGLFAAGTLAALAVTSEYTGALAGFVLFGVAVWQARLRSLWFLAGGVLPAVALGIYHTIAFGGPFTTGYRFSGFADLHQQGFFGVNPPRLGMLIEVLIGDRGLFLITPLVLVGVIGCVALLRDGAQRVRVDAVAGLTVTVLYVMVMAGWSNATGGASPGPRYVLPALPFLLPGVAHAFQRWQTVAWVTTVVGWITMGLATFTQPLAPRAEPWALSYWWNRLLQGETADTLLERYVGAGTLWVPIVVAIALGWVLITRQRRRS